MDESGEAQEIQVSGSAEVPVSEVASDDAQRSPEIDLAALLPSTGSGRASRWRVMAGVAGAQTLSAALRLTLEAVVAQLGVYEAAVFRLSDGAARPVVAHGDNPVVLPPRAAEALRVGSTVLTPELLATPLLHLGEEAFALVLSPAPAATAEGLTFLADTVEACRLAGVRVASGVDARPELLLLALRREHGPEISASAQRTLDHLEQAARGENAVLLAGEPSTGKRDAALALHQLSDRAEGPFVEWRVGAEAQDDLAHALARAEGGTLYVAGVDRLPSEAAELLKRELRREAPRVGPRPVRFVASVLHEAGRSARHAVDGTSLLAAFTGGLMEMPPLRRRKGDVPFLVATVGTRCAARLGRPLASFSAPALKALRDYPWPANFAELEACLSWALLACAPNADVQLWDLPPRVRGGSAGGRSTVLSDMVGAVERTAIVEALEQVGYKKIHAASALGISRPTLDKKIAEYNVRLRRSTS